MIEEIKKALESYSGKWQEKNGVWEFSTVIAERKAFLSKKKLTYSAKMKIDNTDKQVTFSEMLMEVGSGLSGGFGFKAETYNTFGKARQGAITEQSDLFGKKYQYQFDYSEIRSKIETIVKKAGYKFEYQILPVK